MDKLNIFLKAFIVAILYTLIFYWFPIFRMNIWYSYFNFIIDHDFILIFCMSIIEELILTGKKVKFKNVIKISVIAFVLWMIFISI